VKSPSLWVWDVALRPRLLMEAIKLSNRLLEALEDLIALPQQVLECGFSCLQAGL